jgi:hypothetical protein
MCSNLGNGWILTILLVDRLHIYKSNPQTLKCKLEKPQIILSYFSILKHVQHMQQEEVICKNIT